MSAPELVAVAGLVVAVAVLVAVVLGRNVKAEVGSVKAEFRNNGGESFKDAMDAKFAALHDRLDVIEGRQVGIESTVSAVAARVTALEAPKPPTRARKKAAA